MDFVFTVPHTSYEETVASWGYIWVRTARIRATDWRIHDDQADPKNPDRLNYHSHHGPNTHLIVTGDMRIKCSDGEGHNYAGDERVVQPGARYSAKSDRGATFLEGHKCLSPSTAERYIANGKIKAVASPWSDCKLPEEEVLKRWLRNVKFDPTGKARPNLSKGEKPICVWAEAHGPAQDHLSTWFENEWENLQKQPPDCWLVMLIMAVILAGISFVFHCLNV
ncbi:hypothetical protein GGR57DRAFT_453115 [Xylariaceae sp. FL1272]|nr:hypothetical protein GGR57DRAFT_453115 [Xylariaceae sp. FL1272]